MISIEDCIALSGLTRDEVDAISEHERVPEAAATALGSYLMGKDKVGTMAIREMLRDDIREAIHRGNHAHAADLLAALRHFLTENR